jgi:hypothetical protein
MILIVPHSSLLTAWCSVYKISGQWVRVTACAGPEGRQRVAHGVSRGIEGQTPGSLSPGGAAEAPARSLSPLPGLGMLTPHPVPRLTPWATLCRRSAALAVLQPLG